MADLEGPPLPTETVVRLAPPPTPPWYRPANYVLATCVILCFLMFSAVALIGGIRASDERATLLAQQEQTKRELAQYKEETKARSQKEQAEQDCREKRVDDLSRTTSKIAGDVAELFVVLAKAQRGEATTADYVPILESLDRLQGARDAEDAALENAIEECRLP